MRHFQIPVLKVRILRPPTLLFPCGSIWNRKAPLSGVLPAQAPKKWLSTFYPYAPSSHLLRPTVCTQVTCLPLDSRWESGATQPLSGCGPFGQAIPRFQFWGHGLKEEFGLCMAKFRGLYRCLLPGEGTKWAFQGFLGRVSFCLA